jgi:hypothetical protein
MKLLTASNPVAGLLSLPFRDKLRVLRTLALAQLQARQTIKPYQQLRYWSNLPFRHGPIDVVKQSATPFPDNPARPLQRSNPNVLQDELIRHLNEDGKMSGFDFGLQFLDAASHWLRQERVVPPVSGEKLTTNHLETNQTPPVHRSSDARTRPECARR